MTAIIHVVGNLTRDPETREAGKSTVTKVSVANNDKDRGEEYTDFYNIDFWGSYGEALAKYFSKGDRIYVMGDQRKREYQASSGETRTSLDVRGLKWDFAGKTSNSTGGRQSQQDDYEDDVEF